MEMTTTLLRPGDIAQKIETAMQDAFDNFRAHSVRDRTRTALTRFGELGRELGFSVCCKRSCFANADQGEWLYDQLWFVNHPDKKGFLVRVPMALESEFNDTESGIDDDFPKLLLARADVRVWLWQSLAGRKHIDFYKDQVREFGCS